MPGGRHAGLLRCCEPHLPTWSRGPKAKGMDRQPEHSADAVIRPPQSIYIWPAGLACPLYCAAASQEEMTRRDKRKKSAVASDRLSARQKSQNCCLREL